MWPRNGTDDHHPLARPCPTSREAVAPECPRRTRGASALRRSSAPCEPGSSRAPSGSEPSAGPANAQPPSPRPARSEPEPRPAIARANSRHLPAMQWVMHARIALGKPFTPRFEPRAHVGAGDGAWCFADVDGVAVSRGIEEECSHEEARYPKRKSARTVPADRSWLLDSLVPMPGESSLSRRPEPEVPVES